MAHSIRDTQSFLGNIAFPPALPLPGLPASQLLGLEWQAAITLAVSTTGNDTDPTRPARIVAGDWSAKPFATIQAAVDALPVLGAETYHWDTDAVINVAAGTYPGFYVSGKHLDIYIKANLQLATLATGPNSGTATGGSSRTLTFTGAGWTPNDLIGKFLVVSSGPGASTYAKERIVGNTADTITVAGTAIIRGVYAAGSVFTIEDHAVLLSGAAPGLPAFTDYSAYISGCTGIVTIEGIGCVAGSNSGMAVQVNPGYAYFVYCTSSNTTYVGWVTGTGCGTCWMDYCFARNNSYGGFASQGASYLAWFSCGAVNCGTGFSCFFGNSWTNMQAGNYARNCGTGLYMAGAPAISSWGLACDGCGIGVGGEDSAYNCNSSEINNCTGRTYELRQSRVTLRGTHTGTGNAGFGLDARGSGNVFELESGSAVNLTGTLGDVTVDGSPIAWTELATPGDYALDEATGARINRR